MNLELDNTHAKVTLGSVEEKEWLSDYLSFDTMDWRTKSMKRTRLYSVAAERFPSGFLQPVLKRAAADGISIEVLDVRPPAVARDMNADLGWLRDYQKDAVEAALKAERGIVWVPTGGGKCLGLGTPVMKHDGTVVPVESVREGDFLMGPDSQPRRVLSTTQGQGPLFRIVPHRGTPWVCNDVHVLTLKHQTTGEVIDVPLNKFVLETGFASHQGPYKQFSVGPKAATTDFIVCPIGEGDYYGFTLDGDGRFLLGDFTVTHNTELAVAMARAIPGRWLFLVHRVSLLQQTMDRFKLRTGEDAGIVGDGVWMTKRFTVTTFQTLMRKLATPEGKALIESIDGVIVDEAHSTPAETYYRVVQSIRNARYRFGLSGTPLARGDKKSVYTVGALGPVVYRIRPELLIERGVLSRPKIHLIHVDHSRSNFAWDARWQDIYKLGVTENDERNALIVEAVKETPKPALVFVQHVDHGHRLMRLIHKAGLNAEFVYGNASLEQRQSSIKRLVRGDIDVLICSVIFQEGVDIPALQSVVIATGGASSIAAIQRVGRGMRMSEGKQSFTVWDVADRGHRWFEKHTKQRIRAYKREGYEVIGEQKEAEE